MYHFCTYFNSNFLVRGLALYESLVAHVDEFKLYVLCFDDETHSFLKKSGYDRIVPISQAEFEHGNSDLVRCKSNRNMIEYFFTCTPSLPLYILDNYDEVELITYIDADMFFFSSPEPVFEEFGDNSILIIPHRFSDNNKHNERFGKYNVGFLSFRNDEWGRKCLEWWRNKCIEWCYDREEANRFADQKYLDCWPSLFEKVCELTHKGTNLAPWNIDNFIYSKVGEDVFVDDDKLVIYHFNSLNKKTSTLYDIGTRIYGLPLNRLLLTHVYKVYINKIEKIARDINLNIGENRCKQRYNTFIRNVLAIAETEEVIFFSKYFIPIRLCQFLRPISVVKKLIKTMVYS